MIIFGTAVTGKTYHPLQGACPYCDTTSLFMEAGSRYFHLFFVPMFATGDYVQVTCGHCRKKFEYKQMQPEVQQEMDSYLALKKKPVWRNCGCLLIFAFLMIIGIRACGQAVFGSDDEKTETTEDDRYAEMYRNDCQNLSSKPDPKTDPLAVAIKQYVDLMVIDELEKDSFGYLTKTNGNRLLVIMEVRDIKKVQASSRSALLGIIREALEMEDAAKGKELYISVEGQWNTVLVSTPGCSSTDGRFGDTSCIYEFYKPALTKTAAPVVGDTLEEVRIEKIN